MKCSPWKPALSASRAIDFQDVRLQVWDLCAAGTSESDAVSPPVIEIPSGETFTLKWELWFLSNTGHIPGSVATRGQGLSHETAQIYTFPSLWDVLSSSAGLDRPDDSLWLEFSPLFSCVKAAHGGCETSESVMKCLKPRGACRKNHPRDP